MPDVLGDGLRVLSDDECIDLVKRHRFGRVSLAIDGWPAILPVNYLYDGTSVVIRTAPGAKLDQAPLTAVAFEIDDADRYGHQGWSVLVQGPAFDVTASIDELSEHLRDLAVRPWAPGARNHWLKIPSVRIGGRAFCDAQVEQQYGTAAPTPEGIWSPPQPYSRHPNTCQPTPLAAIGHGRLVHPSIPHRLRRPHIRCRSRRCPSCDAQSQEG